MSKHVVKSMETREVSVVMYIAYDEELDRREFVVERSKGKQLLNRCTWSNQHEADSHFDELVIEANA